MPDVSPDQYTPHQRRQLAAFMERLQHRCATGMNPAHWGTKMWAELHGFMAGLRDPIDPAAVLDYLRAFNDRIPECMGCRRRWDAYCQTSPPRLGSAWEAFCWSVDAHNDVNYSFAIPRKVWTYAEAAARWGAAAATPAASA